MKKQIISCIFFALAIFGQAQNNVTWAEKLGFPKGKKVIILHADDIGMCREANVAAEDYLASGNIQSVAIMMPCPYAQEFINWAKAHPKVDIGLHLTLTSEWKTYRWAPLMPKEEVPGLTDPEGKMWRSVQEVVQHASAQEVEKEIRAQIEQSLAWGHRPDHIDTHMGTLYGDVSFVKVFLKVAEEYNIPANAIDLSNPMVANFYKDQGYPITSEVIKLIEDYKLPKLDFFTSVPSAKTYDDKVKAFKALIGQLSSGLTEIIFHPSVKTENLKTITNSWQQRVWEAAMFNDPDLKTFFEESGLIFTNWKEIMQRFEAMKQ
ncbi:polysaccharide deacetylase family protein [Sinomicrobium oceani]|uniref:polysaccharide deacetylase family protein n=1 Tax=Sinomicrobium oceani TaxID=1150368 RepID=UPI00227B0C35|nr:polysaccharide deacetylase family protein [Sinomicrobium oceani]